MIYTQQEKKKRAIKRLAELFHDHWEERRVGSTRVFEHIVPDEWLISGHSTSGGKCREHVVPCALIRDQSIDMYQRGKSILDVSSMIEKYLAIVLISKDEKKRLDNELGWKTTMPPGWSFNSGNRYARLIEAKIPFVVNGE